MRRGHPGWRGENPRHFRPRGSGGSHFRPSHPFGPHDTPRFPLPIHRYRGPRPYNSRPILSDDPGSSDHERQYRGPNHQPISQERRHHDNRERQMLPLMQMRVQESNQGGSFNKSTYFEGNKYNTNNMGDVDHRLRDVDHRPRDVDHRPQNFSPWVNPPFERRHYNNDNSPNKIYKNQGMGDALLPQPDYTGHRPPSSDHYSGISGPNNNNNPYSRSVDDTVNIVRKRLLNRDSQDHPDPTTDQTEIDTDIRKNENQTFHDTPQEQPVKKRVQRQIKSNCNKMKTKIVHQLFKMDKTKIHKLMDNPNSSSKFEYAISSLITESQNSLNRHMRSIAEKSLNTASTSSDFVHDDNNTIYEDTFMRQMQGVLDPQDTILLEDIKPLVLAELSKVLCLDDFDRGEGIDDQGRYTRDDYNAYYNEPGIEYPQNTFYEHEPDTNHETEIITGDQYEDRNYDLPHQSPFEEPPQLFERRPPKRLEFEAERSRSRSIERWQPRRSIDNSTHNKSNEDKFKENEEIRPLFDGNCDQLSEDDDPFAELDKQYHVAVDHNFIEQEDEIILSPISEQVNHCATISPPTEDKKDFTTNLPTPDVPSNNIVKEIDTPLQSIEKSPMKLISKLKNENFTSNAVKVKQEIEVNDAVIKDTLLPNTAKDHEKVKQEPTLKIEPDGEPVKHANDSGKHISRKRSTDSKPSHRKEKRKKSHSECHEAATSIYNMFYDTKSAPKDANTVESTDKGYSDKYVKRKEPPKKAKEKVPEPPKTDTLKKQNINTSHSITSPKDTSNSSGGTPSSKIDKVKLTAIDLFSETKSKKVNVHQAHRNTVTTPVTPLAKSSDEIKFKPDIAIVQSFARKLTKRHMGTQVIRKLRNKECQTTRHKISNNGSQTDPVRFEKNQLMSTDPLERMKEIDMEIQMLLQEKFKLYNSMESNNKNTIGSGSTVGTLGMAVFNVPVGTVENDKEENDEFSADSIAEDFTNLPVEELEQIAMETIDVKKCSSPIVRKRDRTRKVSELSRKNSESPIARNKKARTPNISLIEQIITDDRPIEEIISLDDLERTPARSKKKLPSRASTKKKSRRQKSKPFILDLKLYDLKECCVVLQRLDVTKYLKARAESLKIKINLKSIYAQGQNTENEEQSCKSESVENSLSPVPESFHDYPKVHCPVQNPSNVEETTNDIQIDMMEVCEDIVIGDEVKTSTDVNERVPVCDDIILDNSQSSADYSAPEITEGECKMYDYSTDDTLKRDAVTVTGNADAVLAIECIDNSFIAACLDGNVYHFSTDGQLVSTLRGSNLAVTCLTIVKEKYGTTVYTGSLDSRIRYYDLETGLEKGPECNVLSPIQTMDRAWDTVFVGTRTGFVLQFECKNNMLIPVSTVKFSEQSILALRAMKEGPRKVLLVAARSDNVTIKDAQTGLLLRTLEGPKMTVYSLLFEDGKVYCGTSSHQIHVFDYTSGAHVHAHEGGKGAVCLRATGGLVFAGCYDGCVYVYREGETRPLAQLRGPALMLLSLAIQGTKIIAGYKDRSLYIWKIPLAVLQEMIL